jgi:hypothetical protein
MPKYLFALVSCAFTALVFLNTYEVVWNKDIVIAHSIQRMAAQSIINTVVTDFAVKGNADADSQVADLGGINGFTIPALQVQMHVEAARKVDGLWYQRLSAAHYIGLNKDAGGKTIDYLIYTNTSWRSFPSPQRVEPGMEVQIIDAKGDMSAFTVAEKKVLPLDRSLIVSRVEGRQVILIIEDTPAHVYYGYSLVLQK